MRLLFFLVSRHWASDPLRAALTWFGVALGLAVVTSIHVLDHNTILSELDRKRGDFGRVDFELRLRDPAQRLTDARTALRTTEGIARVGVIAQTRIELERGDRTERVKLFGLAPLGADQFGHYRLARGRDLTDLDVERDVFIGAELADRLGVDVGDELDARAMPIAVITECIDGKRVPRGDGRREAARPFAQLRVAGILEPFRLGRQAGGIVMIGAYSLAQNLGRRPTPTLQVRRTAGFDPDRLRTALADDYVIEERRSALIGESADERAFRNGVKVLGCLAFILGMFVIFHTLSHAIAEKARRVGTLRCLGATQRQVTAAFLVDALSLSALGVVGGIAGGIGLAKLFMAFEVTTLGLGKSIHTFEVPWGTVLALGALGIAFTMLGAAFPLMKIRRLTPQRTLYVRDLAPPADLMRGVHVFLLVVLVGFTPLAYLAMTPLLEGGDTTSVLLQLGGLVAVFFGVVLVSPRLLRWLGHLPIVVARRASPLASFLVGKTLHRAPGRLATAVCGLAVVSLSWVGLRAITASLEREVAIFAEAGLADRMFVRIDPNRPLPPGSWKTFGDVDGVVDAIPIHTSFELGIRLAGTDAEALTAPGRALEGRLDLARAMHDDRGLLVSRRLAELRGLAVNDTIAAHTGGGVVHYRVLAIDDRDGFFPDERAYALCDQRWLENDFCLDTRYPLDYALQIESSADKLALLAGLLNHGVHAQWAKTGDELHAEHKADIARDFLFFDVLVLLMLLIAGTGQLNLMALSALARRRELGVLGALGVTSGDHARVLLLESLVVAFITGIVTVAAGIPLSWVLIRGLRDVSGLAVPLAWPVAGFAAAVGLAFATSLAVAAVVSLRVDRRVPHI